MADSETERLYKHLQHVQNLNADEYEELTATIMESKLQQLPGPHRVVHDHALDCEFGEKQMDVSLQVGNGADEVTAIIECKGSNSPKEKDDLAAFAFYLEHSDVDKGIYVSRSGYRSGAKDIASACGIQLLQINRITSYVEGEITQSFPPYDHKILGTIPNCDSLVNLQELVDTLEDRLALPIVDANGAPTGDTIGDRLEEATESGGAKIPTDFGPGEWVDAEGVDYQLDQAVSRERGETVSTRFEIDFADQVDLRLRDVLADEAEVVRFEEIMHRFAAVETDN